jgi:hypothetical protein
LRFSRRQVLRFVHYALDDSTPKRREKTYKVFHHVWDPAGKRLLTKGPGGLYTHHRGLFYGFNRITYDGGTADIWHCTGETHQAFRRVVSRSAGPVLGRHRVEIDWNGKGGKTFAREERELTAYNVPGGTLLEFASVLRTTGGPVRLDGDPQHAGFHFRADNEVAAKTAKRTVFVRPGGTGKPGEEWNWPGHRRQVNLPWLAMSFVLGGKRYTVAYLDRPGNPKEARFSERTYGRFGSYFAYELRRGKPLRVNYRIWIQEGLMKAPEVAERSAAFADPPAVKVK